MVASVALRARVHEDLRLREYLERNGAGRELVIELREVHFNAPHGRLWLVRHGSRYAELVHTDECGGVRQYRTEQPETMETLLRCACGVRGIVDKTRELYVHQGVRVHFDDVRGLGRFVELAIILGEEGDSGAARATLLDTARRLGLAEETLSDTPYIDLLNTP